MARVITKAESLRLVAHELRQFSDKVGEDVWRRMRVRAESLVLEAEQLEDANNKWKVDMATRWDKLKGQKLLPCPFCGFVPEVDDADCVYPFGRDRSVWEIHCYETGGGCGVDILGDSPEDVIERWNIRVEAKK